MPLTPETEWKYYEEKQGIYPDLPGKPGVPDRHICIMQFYDTITYPNSWLIICPLSSEDTNISIIGNSSQVAATPGISSGQNSINDKQKLYGMAGNQALILQYNGQPVLSTVLVPAPNGGAGYVSVVRQTGVAQGPYRGPIIVTTENPSCGIAVIRRTLVPLPLPI